MADEDDLGAFGQAKAEEEEDLTEANLRPLLVFTFDQDLFGIRLKDVDSVIPWRQPAAIPQGQGALEGVIQDHGRIIAVLRSPSGGAPEGNPSIARIIVCQTRRGLIGLPVTATNHVGPVAMPTDPSPGDVVDSDQGVLTYLEAGALAGAALGERGRA